ncbi:MAG TPA: isochorismatase family protein [Planctomycetota bacterium]|nr:isochorismatase family protein [Planctomycetota bacterium]
MFSLTASNSALLVIDVQERFQPSIPAIAPDQPCGRNCRILIEAARLLQVPVALSEQYVRGLGPTLPHLIAAAGDAPRLEKTHFSCGDDAALAAHIAGLGRGHVVLAGIEAHVCVLATVADLLARGLRVIVAGDAVASRRDESRVMALDAMRDLGALVVPTESIVFRWQRQSGVGCFKQVAALVK